MTAKAKKYANFMTTQYVQYGNIVVDISEHQYYKI